MGRAAAYNPQYGVVGVDQEQLALLVDGAVFMVGKEVADQL